MRKKMFMEICERMKQNHDNLDALHKLNVDLYDFMDDSAWISQHLWSVVLTKEGNDWFSWFMYEKSYLYEMDNSMMAWDENKNEICQMLDDLYNFLVTNNHFNTPTK